MIIKSARLRGFGVGLINAHAPISMHPDKKYLIEHLLHFVQKD